jgi:hypothetical protein
VATFDHNALVAVSAASRDPHRRHKHTATSGPRSQRPRRKRGRR